MKKPIFGFVLTLLCAGCMTAQISSPDSLKGVKIKEADDRPGRALVVASEGYYLFQIVPLVSGSLQWNEKLNEPKADLSFFRHELSAQNFINLMTKIADRENCDLIDISVENKWTAPFGLWGITDWCTTVIGLHRMNYSATLVPREAK